MSRHKIANGRPKPLSPRAGLKRTRYGCGGKLK